MKLIQSKSVVAGLILSCFLWGGCKKDIPKGVIKPAQMENLLYDYHIAKTMADELPYEDKYKKVLYMDYVFKKHNTTEAVFDSSLVWYTRHTDQLSSIYEKINKRYKKEQELLNHLIAIRNKKPKISMPGDSVDIWYKDRVYKLTNALASNKIKFELTADTNYKERDVMVWKMRSTFLPVGINKKDSAFVAMCIKYENDSLLSSVKKITSSGLDSIQMIPDSSYRIKEISGFVYYPGEDTGKSLLVDEIQLMRYHAPKDTTVAVADSIKADSLLNDAKDRVEEVKKENKDTLEKTFQQLKDSVPQVRRSPREMKQLKQIERR